ncbi:MAG: fused response regulator/phosphatase [Pseudomonadales bacterium]|nr:fused response regulator/phosphatase [Pseudomonadales bacterium]
MPAESLRILIADDSDTDRFILQAIIRSQGHITYTATNGLEAVEHFKRLKPDLILLDALMPKMNGFEAAKQIKENMQDDFIPIIFLTSLHDADSLAKCIEAGGDDFLSKPYHSVILQAKIDSFVRMQHMHYTLQSQRDQIYDNNQRLIREQEVAKRTFDKIAHEGVLEAKNIDYNLSPLALFNGDVLLAALHPTGDLCILLGDFTGHGLAAAVGTIPISQTFYSMVAKGFSIRVIAREINAKLKDILPVGVFCCAALIQFDFKLNTVEVFNAALPDIALFNSERNELQQLQSMHVALGILSDEKFSDATKIFAMPVGSLLVAYSDGLIESESRAGEMYGTDRLNKALTDFVAQSKHSRIVDYIFTDIKAFTQSDAFSDDLSLIAVEMIAQDEFFNQPVFMQKRPSYKPLRWNFSYRLEGEMLRHADPTQLMQTMLNDAPMVSSQLNNIYTIISELFVNALDHGVLRLDSKLKSSKNGFQLYLAEKSKRLSELKQGFVEFTVDYQSSESQHYFRLSVKDSGDGFDYEAFLNSSVDALSDQSSPLSGRGLSLVKKLSDSMAFSEQGSRVTIELFA